MHWWSAIGAAAMGGVGDIGVQQLWEWSAIGAAAHLLEVAILLSIKFSSGLYYWWDEMLNIKF